MYDESQGYVSYSLTIANPGEAPVNVEGMFPINDCISATYGDPMLRDAMTMISSMWVNFVRETKEGRSP
jgi:hypothetical protein